MREKLSLFLVLLLLMTTPPQAFAQFDTNFSDMPADWSVGALEMAVKNGLLNGHEGNIRPSNPISRAEIATVINRAFGAHVTASLDDFEDVEREDWHYSELAKAVAMGTLKGDGKTLRPDSSVTREEAFTILGRALSLRATDTDKSFVDLSAVSDWAKEETLGLVNEGYVNGSEGYLNPKAQITRAEFAQLMHNIIKEYVRTPGVVEEISEGNVMINMPDVTLKGVTVTGDLIIGDGVGEGEVTLDDVTVKGRLLVRGGGENSIVIKGDSDIGSITIVKNGNRIRVLNESGRTIQVSEIEGDADVILEGAFGEVTIKSPGITVNARNADIELAIIKGERSEFIVDEGSKIDKIEVIASNVVIGGEGEVDRVEVFAGGTGTTILTPDTEIDVNRGANNVTGTGDVEIEQNETYVNGSTPTKDAKPLKEESSGGSSGGSSSGSSDGETNPPPATTYTINYSVIGSNGTLTANKTNGSSLAAGTSVTFTAIPAEGYEVKEWKVNGAVVTGENTLTRTVNVNTTVTVEFRWIPEPERFSVLYYTVGEGGTISSTINSGVGVLPNTELTFTATPDPGYEVKEWKVNDVVVEAENILTTIITAYTRVTVEFEEIPVVTHPLRITVTPSDATVTVTDSSESVMTGTFNGTQWTYTLPVGTYGIKVEKEGYYTYTDTQDMIGPSNHEITLEEDTTPPELVGVTSSPLADEVTNDSLVERHIWIEEGDSIEIQITAEDDNLRRVKIFEDSSSTVEGFWYYADTNVYNGPTDMYADEDEMRGMDVSYVNGAWTIKYGPYYSSDFNFPIILELDFEDYAGNKWSEVESSLEDRTFVFIPKLLDRTDLNEIKEFISSIPSADYPPEIWANIETALDMPESTQEEINDKVAALVYAINLLPPYIEVTQVTINETDDTIIVGKTYNLTATVLPNDATDRRVWWTVESGPGVINEDTGEFSATEEGEIVVKAASYSYPIINDTITFTATSPVK